MSDDVFFLSQLVRDSMELQAMEALTRTVDRENDFMKPLPVPNYSQTCSINLLIRHNASLHSH